MGSTCGKIGIRKLRGVHDEACEGRTSGAVYCGEKLRETSGVTSILRNCLRDCVRNCSTNSSWKRLAILFEGIECMRSTFVQERLLQPIILLVLTLMTPWAWEYNSYFANDTAGHPARDVMQVKWTVENLRNWDSNGTRGDLGGSLLVRTDNYVMRGERCRSGFLQAIDNSNSLRWRKNLRLLPREVDMYDKISCPLGRTEPSDKRVTSGTSVGGGGRDHEAWPIVEPYDMTEENGDGT